MHSSTPLISINGADKRSHGLALPSFVRVLSMALPINRFINALSTLDMIGKTARKTPPQTKETFGILLCQTDSEDFQKTIIETIANNVKAAVPEILDNKNADYLFTFVMYGSLNVLRVWIQSGFDTPTRNLAELIYQSCNNVAK